MSAQSLRRPVPSRAPVQTASPVLPGRGRPATAGSIRLLSLLTLLLLAALAPACANAPPAEESPTTIVVVDDAGHEVRLAQPAERVIALLPSVTDLLVAMGARQRLVGRTDDDRGQNLAQLPSVGRGLTPNLEAVAALRPELVITWPDALSRSIFARLRALGIPTYAAASQTLADVMQTIHRMGKLLGMPAAADSLARTLESQLDAVRRAVAGREQPSVFYVVWNDPPVTTGPGTFVHELIGIAGGRNIFADAQPGWPQVSLEQVVYRRPDVLILPRSHARPLDIELLRTTPGWRDLEAVKAGRAYVVPASLFNRPGPRVGEAARRLAELLHPGGSLAQATP